MVDAVAPAVGQAHLPLPNLQDGNLAQVQNAVAPQPRLRLIHHAFNFIRNPSPLVKARIKSAVVSAISFKAMHLLLDHVSLEPEENFALYTSKILFGCSTLILGVNSFARRQFIPLVPNFDASISLNHMNYIMWIALKLLINELHNSMSSNMNEFEKKDLQLMLKMFQPTLYFQTLLTIYIVSRPTANRVNLQNSTQSNINDFSNLSYSDISPIASLEDVAQLNYLDVCGITLTPGHNITEPVYIQNNKQVYEFSALKNWLILNPKNPITDEFVNINDLIKIMHKDLLLCIEIAKNK